LRLKAKIAIVTGGAHGMGEGTRKGVSEKQGAEVVVATCSEREGEGVAAANPPRAGGQGALHKDRRHRRSNWGASVADTWRRRGRLDIPGQTTPASAAARFGDHDDAAAAAASRGNAEQSHLGTRRAAKGDGRRPARRDRQTLSSIMGIVGSDEGIRVPRVEGGGAQYTKTAGGPLRPQGVRVKTVIPGYIRDAETRPNAGTSATKIR